MNLIGDSAYILNALYDWADAAGNVQYMMYFNLADGGVGMTLDQGTVLSLPIASLSLFALLPPPTLLISVI